MAELRPDLQPYGSVEHPVCLDVWSYIVEVGWPSDKFVLVEMPKLVIYPILLGEPAGLGLTHMDVRDPVGWTNPFPAGAGGEDFFPAGIFAKGYGNTPGGIVIPKADLTGLKTTASLRAGSNTIDMIASTDGLGFPVFSPELGGRFPITGAGIQPGTIFRQTAVDAGMLDKPATASGTAVPIKIKPWVFEPLDHNFAPFRLYPYGPKTVDSGDPSSGWLIPPLPVYTFDIFHPGTGAAQVTNFFATHPAFAAIPVDHFVISYFSDNFPQPQTVDYNDFAMGGDTIVGLGAGAPPDFTTLWQVKFDYSVYTQPFLVNVSLAKEVSISEEFFFPVSDANGVRLSRFPSGADFLIRSDGYIDAVRIDRATGLHIPVEPLWQASLGIAPIGQQGTPISSLTQLGRFDQNGVL